MTDPAVPAESSLAVMLTAAIGRFRSAPADAVLSLAALSVLDSVDAWGPLTLSQLADIEFVKPSSVSRHVSRLLAAGLLAADKGDDRRVVMISMTGAGRAALAAERDRFDAWAAAHLPPPGAARADLGRAVAILARLASA